ncbi:MAG TPA: hypothetical protein VF587_18030 [Solirubrobacteraceae bacterium]|jgi:hypothetical protein
MRRAVITALVLGFLAGTFLAGLPHAQNEQCMHAMLDYEVSESAGYSGGSTLWPFSTRCELSTADGTRVVTPGAGVLEGIAWSALAALLFGLALLRRTPATHGAAAAVTLLAVIGFLWQFGGEMAPVLMFLITFAFLVPYAVLRRLEHGGPVRCALTAYVLTGTVSFAWACGAFTEFEYAGIFAALAVGALTTRATAAVGRPRPAAAAAL